MNKVIIGCPVRNDFNSLKLMLNSLIESTNSFDKIVFVDGNSSDGTLEYLRYLDKLDPRIELIEANTKTPLEAYNLIFKYALENKADLLLTQTDVVFPKLYNRDWLKEMSLVSESEGIGAVTTYNGYGISGPDYIDGLRWLGGWCTYISLKALEKLKGYDDSFPNGYGVDVDFTYRLLKEGFDVRLINYFVDHHMANSREHDRDPNTEQMKQDSSIYFKKKWSLQ